MIGYEKCVWTRSVGGKYVKEGSGVNNKMSWIRRTEGWTNLQ
jgi:hypothetical protein